MILLIPSFLIAFLSVLVLGRPAIMLLQRLKARQTVSLDAPERHRAKTGTPTMGGILIMAGMCAGALFSASRTPGLVAVLVGTLAFAGIGLVDDLLIILRGKNLGLKARQKLALQGMGAILFVAWHHNPTAVAGASGAEAVGVTLWGLAHVLFIVGLSNAVNLTDGLDGLAAGVAVPVLLVLAFIGALTNRPPFVADLGVAIFCAALAGACLGFMWFNAHPAGVFMGDTGSLALGAGIGMAAVLLGAEWVTLLAAGVYVVEMVSVILQVVSFKTTRRRIFRMTPLHHHFELGGWAETQIVARFTLAAVALGACALWHVISN